MEFDSANYSITPNTNQDIQEKDLGYNVTIIKGNLYSIPPKANTVSIISESLLNTYILYGLKSIFLI